MNWKGWLKSLNDEKAGIDAEKCVRRIGAVLFLLLIIVGSSWAGSWDFNPAQEAVKHRNDVTSDVQGTGYVREYMKVNTNNLSLQELAHGSGNMDFAEILYDEQKTTPTASYIYWIDYTTGLWKREYPGASSAITYTRQYDNAQSSTSFAYGRDSEIGWSFWNESTACDPANTPREGPFLDESVFNNAMCLCLIQIPTYK